MGTKSGQERRKNKRGLTVSFVQNNTDKGSRELSVSKRPLSRHATQRDLDAGDATMSALNASPYGAMERRYSQTRREGSFPPGFPGEDPRLGYDWIAGLLDASESYLSEKDDRYFQEMKEFRQVNFEECHGPKEVV